MSVPDTAEFDRWYGVVARSDRRRAFVAAQLGLPDELCATGFLSGDGLAEIRSRLALQSGDTLADLGCGRAGYGLALIEDVDARLVGIDFSAVALRGAKSDAAARGLGDRVSFLQGELTETGVPDESASAVVCIDALQFAGSVPDALTECRRILRPGGHLVATTWQSDSTDNRVPERIRRLDLTRDLTRAGFDDVEVVTRPTWSAAERRLWAAALDLTPGEDEALGELRDEAASLLPLADSLHRVLALARRPTKPVGGG